MKLTHIIFDLDGLLVDSERLQFESFQLAFREFGYELTEAGWARWHSVEASAPRFVRDEGLDIDAEAVRAVKKVHYETLISTSLEAKPGAMELVKACAERFPMAVASGSRIESIEACLNKFGVRGHFEVLCSGTTLPRSKPYPDVYLEALKALGAKADSAIALEDSNTGLRAAHAAGIACLVCPDAFMPKGDDPFALASEVVDSLVKVSVDDLVRIHKDHWERTVSG